MRERRGHPDRWRRVYPKVANCGISDHPGSGLAIVCTHGGIVTGNVFVRDKRAVELSAASDLTIGNNIYVADRPGDKSCTRDDALFIGEGSNHNMVTGENIGGDQPAAWTGAGICITGNAAGNAVTGVRLANCAVGIRIDSTVGNNVVTGGYIDPACPVSLAVTAGKGNVNPHLLRPRHRQCRRVGGDTARPDRQRQPRGRGDGSHR